MSLRASLASAPSTSRSALDTGPSTSAAATAGEVAAYETVASAGPSTSAAARKATKKAAPKKATPKRGARARGRGGGRGRAPENEGTGDDSVTAIDESVTIIDDSAPAAVEYTPERSEPDEIDAREFSNNVSDMFDLTCGGDGGDDDSDEESVYHSCEDSDEGEGGGGGSAEGSTLNADQIVERMRTMFETSLMLHAKGKYMKVIDSKFDIFLIWDSKLQIIFSGVPGDQDRAVSSPDVRTTRKSVGKLCSFQTKMFSLCFMSM